MYKLANQIYTTIAQRLQANPDDEEAANAYDSMSPDEKKHIDKLMGKKDRYEAARSTIANTKSWKTGLAGGVLGTALGYWGGNKNPLSTTLGMATGATLGAMSPSIAQILDG